VVGGAACVVRSGPAYSLTLCFAGFCSATWKFWRGSTALIVMNVEAENEDPSPKTIRVIAKYNFEGRNNDEVSKFTIVITVHFQISFQKNDVITVTQQIDGGWWEGVIGNDIGELLNFKTYTTLFFLGWFPADFVGVIKTQSSNCYFPLNFT
jgi:hypothetical protein